ncbi:alpha/beta fold hydrolase BchO [Rivibacter subsaxonicus]|uniref:Magnesium chelatase accessory protein n=1 Tax=Rivibacter subsaxonicus TaxID=457575 RepID=A0A4Q7W0T6_9BURK|nr:alpha/beta fold hydrolase BchO [Rivibacter subsaxonicus]RZU02844.1 magnesium chelatase accessory protein [Rivibacter subsaxonicus]
MNPAPALDWALDGPSWPHAVASRFVLADGLRWHVQQMGLAQGEGPTLLLLHGTGASTHSWRGLLPLLAPRFHLIAPDLPGHAFSATPASGAQMSLPGMARALAALLATLDARPNFVLGHSAGAAIAIRMSLDRLIEPAAIAAVNPALLPFGGLPGRIFGPAARLLAAQPWVPRLFARRAARPAVLQGLLDATGSTLDAEGMALYGRLVRSPAHAAGALSMMANWDLQPLRRELPALRVPLHLIVGANDHTVPPRQAQQVHALLPASTLIMLPGLGHLAHEEQPVRVVQQVLAVVQAASTAAA